MRSLRRTSQFKKDVKRALKRGLDIGLMESVIRQLFAGEKLQPRLRDHALGGEYRDCRDCHIEADWLLIYRLDPDELVLIRTGTHADLFE